MPRENRINVNPESDKQVKSMQIETVKERIEQIKQALVLHQGALQESQYWLNQLETETNG